MAANAKSLMAVGLAFVAGVSATALLMSAGAPKATVVVTVSKTDLPSSANAAMAAEPTRGWTDPVRTKAVAATPSQSSPAVETAAIAPAGLNLGQASNMTAPPPPPARPTDTALEAKTTAKEQRQARSAVPVALSAVRNASEPVGRRNGLVAAPGGYRTASYPG